MTKKADFNPTYYVDMKPKMMRDFDKIFKFVCQALGQHFGESQIDQLLNESRRKYEELIPQLPYIGGKKNTGTTNLVGGAQLLAIIRPLEKQGLSERAIGKVIYDTMELRFSSMPRVVRWFMGKLMMSRPFINRMKNQADAPHYPGGWQKKIVVCKDYDFCQDVTECGIVTLFRQHGAEAYVPYMCLGDYAMFRAFGIGFTRTQTIGNGAPVCDFRFKKHGTTLPSWPPENLEEFKQ
jgi:hypothetical protein